MRIVLRQVNISKNEDFAGIELLNIANLEDGKFYSENVNFIKWNVNSSSWIEGTVSAKYVFTHKYTLNKLTKIFLQKELDKKRKIV